MMKRVINQIRAGIKYALAGRTRSWQLSDYPLQYKQQYTGERPHKLGRLEMPRWSVQIINWWQMGGLGETREAALANLAKNFEGYRANHTLPRPGCRVPIEYSPSVEIQKKQLLLEDFARRVLDLEPGDYIVSDESSLWDFCLDENLDPLFEKIRNVYGIDVSDIGDAKIWKVLERLATAINKEA
jgi:hypothetical protein